MEQLNEAVAEYIQAIPEPARNAEIIASLKQAFVDSGMAGFRRKYAAVASGLAERRLLTPLFVATIYASLGDNDAAFEWIEKAFSERAPTLSHIQADPRFESLQSDPRFSELLRRMGLSE